MQNNSANPSRDPQKEQLKKEQMKLRKTGIALCILAVVATRLATARRCRVCCTVTSSKRTIDRWALRPPVFCVILSVVFQKEA